MGHLAHVLVTVSLIWCSTSSLVERLSIKARDYSAETELRALDIADPLIPESIRALLRQNKFRSSSFSTAQGMPPADDVDGLRAQSVLTVHLRQPLSTSDSEVLRNLTIHTHTAMIGSPLTESVALRLTPSNAFSEVEGFEDEMWGYKVDDDRLCHDTMSRFLRVLPCRSTAGVIPPLARFVSVAAYRRLDIVMTRHSDSIVSVLCRLRLILSDVHATRLDDALRETLICPGTDAFQLKKEKDCKVWEKKPGIQSTQLTIEDVWRDGSLEKNTSVTSEPSWLRLERYEVAHGGSSSRRLFSEWRYILRRRSDSLEDMSGALISDRFPAWMQPVTHGPALRGSCVQDVSYEWLSSEHELLQSWLMRVRVRDDFHEDECAFSLFVSKSPPSFPMYALATEGGFATEGPWVVLPDSTPASLPRVFVASTSQWTLAPLLDVTACFNVIALSCLSVLMLYSRSLKYNCPT